MMNREYDGEPLDMTWDSGPWANDGETVDATDSTNGNMTTIEWPDGATDPEELNDDQREIIKTAARNPDIENWAEIQRLADIDKEGNSYAADTLKQHWPERRTAEYDGVKSITQPPNRGPDRALTDRDVDKIRMALLNGMPIGKLESKFDASLQTIRRAAKGVGSYASVDCKTPKLSTEGGPSGGDWKTDGVDSNSQSTTVVSKPYPPATVDTWRKRALNGENASDIASEYGHLWPADISAALRGDANIDGDATQPELEWANSSREWVTTEPDTEQQTIEPDTNTEEEPEPQPESEPTLEGQTVSKQPSVPNDSNVSKRAVAGVVAGVVAVVWLLRRIF